MDFGRQDVSNESDFDSTKRELNTLVRSALDEEKPDARLIYSDIKERVGSENTDDSMLNFAINSAINQITKAKKSGKPLSKVDLQKQIDLVVDWALIKIRGKDNFEISQTGKTNAEDIDYGTGGDSIVLKDFKAK